MIKCKKPEIKLEIKVDPQNMEATVSTHTINIDGSPIKSFPLPSGAKVNKDLLEHVFDTDKRVPDVHRYDLTINATELVLESPESPESDEFVEKSKYYDRELTIDNAESFKKAIVILLESPHKDEYDEKFNPIAPAQGATGDALDNHLASILFRFRENNYGGLEKGKTYPVLLVNPIPYQCSLWHVFESSIAGLKDKIWRLAWNFPNKSSKGKGYFQCRLNKWLNKINPVLILNLCTSGLKDTIKFDGDKLTVITWNGYHPSAWTSHNSLPFSQMRLEGKAEGYLDFEYDRDQKKALRIVIRKAKKKRISKETIISF